MSQGILALLHILNSGYEPSQVPGFFTTLTQCVLTRDIVLDCVWRGLRGRPSVSEHYGTSSSSSA
jgi:hypothetical protein